MVPRPPLGYLQALRCRKKRERRTKSVASLVAAGEWGERGRESGTAGRGSLAGRCGQWARGSGCSLPPRPAALHPGCALGGVCGPLWPRSPHSRVGSCPAAPSACASPRGLCPVLSLTGAKRTPCVENTPLPLCRPHSTRSLRVSSLTAACWQVPRPPPLLGPVTPSACLASPVGNNIIVIAFFLAPEGQDHVSLSIFIVDTLCLQAAPAPSSCLLNGKLCYNIYHIVGLHISPVLFLPVSQIHTYIHVQP